jgi:hypothetical protein
MEDCLRGISRRQEEEKKEYWWVKRMKYSTYIHLKTEPWNLPNTV